MLGARSAVRVLILVPLLLVGCPTPSPVPTGQDTRDYRITYDGATATESCGASVKAEAEAFAEFTEIYRIHFPEQDDLRVDVWWRHESDTESMFSHFASGIIDGSLDEGRLDYAGGPYFEERSGGVVEYDIEGSARSRFSDELIGGREAYVVTDSDDPDSPTGCVFELSYSGRLLAEQEPE
jgi:hypothetical protein